MFIELLWFILSVLFTTGEASVKNGSISGTFWENEFIDESNNKWFYTCHGKDEATEIPIPEMVRHFLEINQDICTDKSLKRERDSCLLCQVYCQQSRPRNKCFDSQTGALYLHHPSDPSKYIRYCGFQLQLIKTKGDRRYSFPDKPNNKDEDCNPQEHSCSHITRDCLHYNMTHDAADTCHKQPSYCAHMDENWMLNFGAEGPDCARLSLENFQNYLYDIDPWGHRVDEEPKQEYIERWFICDCNHPFTRNHNSVTFSDCKMTVDRVLDDILNLSDYDKCRLANNITEEMSNPEDGGLCQGLRPPISKPHIVMPVSIAFLILAVCAAIYVYRTRTQSVIYGPPESQPTQVTAISESIDPTTVTTPLLPAIFDGICYDGSVETKAVPRILDNYLAVHPNLRAHVTTQKVLHGNIGVKLDKFCQQERLTYNISINILKDIAWWINALHGDTTTDGKNWSIFHGAISPQNIAIIQCDSKIHALVVNFELAQDILNHAGTVCACTNQAKINIKYLPPEMIIGPERQEARGVLSADIYGFACITWKLLRCLSIQSNSDPFDYEITRKNEQLSTKKCDIEVLKMIFKDTSVRPSLSGLERSKYGQLIKIVEECWSAQPVLRLTGAQLFWRMNETFSSNNNYDQAGQNR